MTSTRTPLDAWVTGRRPRPHAHWRLLCLPYAGGGASLFRAWPESLPDEVEVWPIQYPGRENRLRDPLFRDLNALVQTLGQALLPALDRPYAIFGHSLGGLIGFELARRLAEHATGPAHLFIAGMRAPQTVHDHTPIHSLPDAAFIEALRRLQGTPEEVLQNAELMELFLPVLRADFEMVETYHYAPGAPLACPISTFGGRDDHRVHAHDLQAWAKHTQARFHGRMLPGDHFFVRGAPQPLLEAVAHDLNADA